MVIMIPILNIIVASSRDCGNAYFPDLLIIFLLRVWLVGTTGERNTSVQCIRWRLKSKVLCTQRLPSLPSLPELHFLVAGKPGCPICPLIITPPTPPSLQRVLH